MKIFLFFLATIGFGDFVSNINFFFLFPIGMTLIFPIDYDIVFQSPFPLSILVKISA